MISHYTVGHPPTQEMEWLEASSRLAGMRFHALPRSPAARETGVPSTFICLRDALAQSQLADDDLVLFTDACDALVLADASTIGRSFRAAGVDLLFGGEKELWPKTARDAGRSSFFRARGGRSPFLSAGCSIGTARAVRGMVSFCLDTSAATGITDAQHLAQLFAMASAMSPRIRVAVDSERLIFGTRSLSEDDYELAGRSLRARDSGRNIGVLHMNGDRTRLNFLHLWSSLYLEARLHSVDLGLIDVSGQFLMLDRAEGRLGLRKVLNEDTLVAVMSTRGRIALLTAEGMFVTFRKDGRIAASSSTWREGQMLSLPALTDRHGRQLSISFHEPDPDMIWEINFRPLPLIFIENLRLSRCVPNLRRAIARARPEQRKAA